VRWPWRRGSEPVEHLYTDPRKCDDFDDDNLIACVFCGRGVEETETDPVEVRVIARTRPPDGSLYDSFYGHQACLVSCFTEDEQRMWRLFDRE
jgi:hypothetical protein